MTDDDPDVLDAQQLQDAGRQLVTSYQNTLVRVRNYHKKTMPGTGPMASWRKWEVLS